MDLISWLQQEIDTRGWGQAELARRSGVTPGQISRLLNGTRKAGPELCISIAKGLGLPREEVFRMRGWLLNESEKEAKVKLSPESTELAVKIDKLPSPLRNFTLQAANAIADTMSKNVAIQQP